MSYAESSRVSERNATAMERSGAPSGSDAISGR